MINRRKALAAIPALGASVLASAAHGQAGFSFARKQDKLRKESDFMKEFLLAVKLDFNT